MDCSKEMCYSARCRHVGLGQRLALNCLVSLFLGASLDVFSVCERLFPTYMNFNFFPKAKYACHELSL